MTDRIYNIAIAGCGKVAHIHAKAIQEISNARLAAVWSRTNKSALEFSKKYKTLPYSDITKMVVDNNIDLLIVCNPHPFHKDPAVEAANAGANLLVEKPLAVSLHDCDEMINVCRNQKVKLGVISQRRWYEPVKRVKEAIDAEKIGRPVLGTVQMLGWRDKDYYDADEWRGTWEMEGGGVLVNQAPHQIDLFLWYMGEIDEVYGLWKNLNHPYIEVEDTALAVIKFKNGSIGNIIVSNSQKPGIFSKIHVHGSNGSSVGVQTDGGAMFIAGMSGIKEPPVNDLWTVPGEETILGEWKKKDADVFSSIDPVIFYMKCQIEDYINALENNREPLVTGEAGRKTVEFFTAVYRSTLENKPVKFPLVS
jgi:UDP-N-acetyl-2-amino-2-deoxyglucuronate dehydrogenase